jgi:hypothetical protein
MEDKEVSVTVDNQIKDFHLDLSSLVVGLQGQPIFLVLHTTNSRTTKR